MLAFELFLKNQGREGGFGKAVPVKKVFVSFKPSKTIQVDPKSLEEYGGKTTPKSEYLQKLFSMPLMNQSEVGLPDKTTGARSSKPFLQLYGYFTKGKCSISINANAEDHSFTFDFETQAEQFKGKKPIQTHQDKKNYFIDKQLLFDAYVKAGILDPKGQLSADTTHVICKKFAEFLKERIKGEKDFQAKGSFILVVLPQDKPIIYHTTPGDSTNKKEFSDSFGQMVKAYGMKTTKNAKFMSFDDRAFAVNCSQGQTFYKNLGIGDNSVENIGLPPEGRFNIGGLDWYFLNLSTPKTEFEQTNKGIYEQLVKNYGILHNKEGDKGMLKVICLKGSQAKLEVLIDENIPTKRLADMLVLNDNNYESHVQAMEETLINKDGRTTQWNDYICGVRSLLSGKGVDRYSLLQTVSKKARKLAFEYKSKKKGSADVKHFFYKAEFCLKLLTKNHGGDKMDTNEEIAYNIGEIAGQYINFKRKAKETTNSTEDILAYSKYDRDKLRFIFQRICLGTNLSKNETLKKNMESFIRGKKPKAEVNDVDSAKDYAYFFYKGVFNQLGGEI